MSDSTQNGEKHQSGARVFLGILGFMIGITLLLVLIKYLFGL
jgi:hypothetical protein